MTKKRRGKRYDYSKHEITWSNTKIGENCEEYYGLHRDGARIKIDIKLDVFCVPMLFKHEYAGAELFVKIKFGFVCDDLLIFKL